MARFPKFDEFLERQQSSVDAPPNKGAAPYHAPHAKNDGSVKVRVAEKSSEKPFGDYGTPELMDPKRNIPQGVRPSDKGVTVEGKSKNIKDGKNSKPLGYEATPALKDPKKNHPLGSKPSASLTTESFLRETKDLSDKDFISKMIQDIAKSEKKGDDDDDDDDGPSIPKMYCQYTGKQISPSSHEVAKYMAHMLPQNERAVRIFVRELTSTPNALSSLLREMVGHGELYDELVNQIGLGETKVARKFVKAMQDNHMKFLNEMGMMMQSEAVSQPMSNRLPKSTDDDSVAAEPEDDELGAFGDNEMDSDDMSPDDMEMPDDDGMSLGDSPDDMGGDDGSQGMGDTPAMKLNKEFAYHHMIKEMSNYDNMASVMREIMGG